MIGIGGPSAGSDEQSSHHVVEWALTPPAIVRYSLKDFQEAVRLAYGEAGQERSYWTSPLRGNALIAYFSPENLQVSSSIRAKLGYRPTAAYV
jgi:hypothetical protein